MIGHGQHRKQRRLLHSVSVESLKDTEHYKSLIANNHSIGVALADTRDALRHNRALK